MAPSATPALLTIRLTRAVIGDDAVGPGVDGVPIGHVEVLRRDLDAEALALRHGLGQTGVVDVAQREVRTTPGQRVGQRPPDARARSR